MDHVVETSRETIQQGSSSFSSAARLFPLETRESAWMLYAWCRYCDDVIDGQTLGFGMKPADTTTARERLATLTRLTEQAMGDAPPDDPVFTAFHRVVKRHHIPKRFPLELLEGFAMDIEGRRYDTLADTLSYGYHVAGVVGVMMSMVMGVRDQPTLNRASDLGIGFQLTNICRDVMEDAGAGRVYLPADWLAAEGVTPETVTDPASRAGVHRVVCNLLDEADGYYDSAVLGLQALDFRSAWAIAAARGIYRDIGRRVRREGTEAWDQRAVVPKPRKIYLALRGLAISARTSAPMPLNRDASRAGLWTMPETRGPQHRHIC